MGGSEIRRTAPGNVGAAACWVLGERAQELPHGLALLTLLFRSSMTVFVIVCSSLFMALPISKAAVTFQRPVWSTFAP